MNGVSSLILTSNVINNGIHYIMYCHIIQYFSYYSGTTIYNVLNFSIKKELLINTLTQNNVYICIVF
jgi:hypothetical protein